MSETRILLSGGSGVLGRELRTLLPGVYAPTRAELDIRQPASVLEAVRELRPDVIVHAAAYTDVAGAERERAACWRTNVAGTRAVVTAARDAGARLVHISTDYVFHGGLPGASGADARGPSGYREDDPPGPVRNYYALSKLAAEEVARTLPGTLVIRTSFRPRAWPYPVAFTDVFTSQDYVDVIAPDIALAVRNLERIPFDTLHIATGRKSVYELARRRRPDVRAGTKVEAGVALPDDITLDVGRWRELKASLTP
ncbi:MAG TPA: NAD(P)-dependent oxidoreductase [Trueperaceae bacterium]|nr:NAD(P)-dependent oxidoreductase [Trueperaceae bacterium]